MLFIHRRKSKIFLNCADFFLVELFNKIISLPTRFSAISLYDWLEHLLCMGARVCVNIVVIYVQINVCMYMHVHTCDFQENMLLKFYAFETEMKIVENF